MPEVDPGGGAGRGAMFGFRGQCYDHLLWRTLTSFGQITWSHSWKAMLWLFCCTTLPRLSQNYVHSFSPILLGENIDKIATRIFTFAHSFRRKYWKNRNMDPWSKRKGGEAIFLGVPKVNKVVFRGEKMSHSFHLGAPGTRNVTTIRYRTQARTKACKLLIWRKKKWKKH
jgi:hypothetical protein